MSGREPGPRDEASSALLEHQYRRLLRMYPRARRVEVGEELLGVLLDAAADGQTRPTPSEAVDLVRSGLAHRLQAVITPPSPAWFDALAIVSVLLPAMLCVRAIRSAAMTGRWLVWDLQGRGMSMSWPKYSSQILDGWNWIVPASWCVVTMLLVSRRYRWAGPVAIVAAVVDAVHVLGLSTQNAYLAHRLVPVVALEIVAAALLIRSRFAARGIEIVTRRGLVLVAFAAALLYGGYIDAYGIAGAFTGELNTRVVNASLIASIAIVAALTWKHRATLTDPVGRRVLAAGLALVSMKLVADHTHSIGGFDHNSTRILVEFALCLAAPVTVVVVLAGVTRAVRHAGSLTLDA